MTKRKKKINVELLDRLASAVSDQDGGDLPNFLEDLKVLGGRPTFTADKAGLGVKCRMANIDGAVARGLRSGQAQQWAALRNWSNAARRLINQEAA